MHAIKNQDVFRKKICSKALPSFFSIMILRKFTRVKYFNVPYIWEEENSFWRIKQWQILLFQVENILITYIIDENANQSLRNMIESSWQTMLCLFSNTGSMHWDQNTTTLVLSTHYLVTLGTVVLGCHIFLIENVTYFLSKISRLGTLLF